MSADQSVKVAVRIRPLVPSEQARGCENITRKTPLQPQIVVNSGTKNTDMYTFNYVFAPEDTQEMIYENAVKNMVVNLFKGKKMIVFYETFTKIYENSVFLQNFHSKRGLFYAKTRKTE